MATVGTTNPTISDYTRQLGKDNKIQKIVELLSMQNEILEDMVWGEANQTTGHLTTVRSGLPAVAWRRLYEGVKQSKGRAVQVTDTIGNLEGWSTVDALLVKLASDAQQFRLNESKGFIEALNQEMASSLFYSSVATDPEKIHGLSPRYDSLSGENAVNIINGSGAGSDNMSVWMIVWGMDTCHGIFPKGSTVGIEQDDYGEVTATDASGGKYRVYEARWTWNMGLSVRDWRYVVRIANIDSSDLKEDAATGANLINLMVRALEQPPSLSAGRVAFYVPKKIKTYLRLQALNKANVQLTFETVAGKQVLMFGEAPVRKCESLLETEATVA